MSPATAGLLDWAAVMSLGLGVLRLAPTEFWAATPRELRCALEGLLGRAGQAPLDRRGLEQLMRRFPDRPPAGAD